MDHKSEWEKNMTTKQSQITSGKLLFPNFISSCSMGKKLLLGISHMLVRSLDGIQGWYTLVRRREISIWREL